MKTSKKFPSPVGDFIFILNTDICFTRPECKSFRPLSGILFLFCMLSKQHQVNSDGFRPLSGILFLFGKPD